LELDWKSLFLMFLFISIFISMAIPAIDPNAPLVNVFDNTFLNTYVGDLRSFNWVSITPMNPIPDPTWDVTGFLRGIVAFINVFITIYNIVSTIIVFLVNTILYIGRIIFLVFAIVGLNIYNFIQTILYVANLPFGIILSFILVTLLGLMVYGFVKGLIPLVGGKD